MQFEYDPEKLIEEIKKRGGLWDNTHADFRAKSVRNSLWYEVVNEFINPELKVTKSEKRELGIQLQKKWKSMRDCFQKYINNPKRTRRPYIYTKQLQFLLRDQPLPQNEDAEGSSDTEDSGAKSKVWKLKRTLKTRSSLKLEGPSDSDDNSQDYQEDSGDYTYNDDNVRPSKVSKLEESHIVNTDEFVFANVGPSKPETDDADKMFLLSLLPHFKTIPEEMRLNVKLDLMQVLKNANYAYNRGA